MAGLPGKSALAAITATYTDSEEEEDKIKEIASNPSSPDASEAAASSDVVPKTIELDDETFTFTEDVASRSERMSFTEDPIDDDDIDVIPSKKGRLEVDDDDVIFETNDVQEILLDDTEAGKPDEAEDANAGESTPTETTKSRIPKEPQGKPAENVQKRVEQLHSRWLKQKGSINVLVQNNKQFRNPSIYEKLINLCGITEFGTNFRPEIYDPHSWTESSYYDELANIQRADMERREKEKKERSKVEFISGTAKKPIATVSATTALDDAKQRKSKWDQRGAGGPATLPTIALQPVVQQIAASSQKATVISAFGTLNPAKKSK